MTTENLLEILNLIQNQKCETQNLEVKAAYNGCPKRLYDTLSSFSNQDEGGIIIFGVDESNDYAELGVYDAQDLQKKVNAQCLEMEPIVRPLLTVAEKNGKYFMSAEIPGIDVASRPCFYSGKGRMKGSYIRSGDSDEPMTEYEVYSYEAFRRKYQDDCRAVPRATAQILNPDALGSYLTRLKQGKKHLAQLEDAEICNLMSVYRDNAPTLSAVMLFCPYPQAYFPQLCIIATCVPGNEDGAEGPNGERFYDNERIEGTIPEMYEQAMAFVRKNMRNRTIIDPTSGTRNDRTDYPVLAVREALLNALVHRDYSIHTEGKPIQLILYQNRLEIHSPGGIYGRIRIDQLGKVQPDTRNPVLALALETMAITENRYTGIPTIRKEMDEYGLPEPEFINDHGTFTVKLYNEMAGKPLKITPVTDMEQSILDFCEKPRSKKEIAQFLGISTVNYAYTRYVLPLVERKLLHLTIPENIGSRKQQYYSK